MNKNQSYEISEFVRQFSPVTIMETKKVLSTGKLQVVTNSLWGYDAVVEEDGETFFIEVTLDRENKIEDLHCTCNIVPCVHVCAALWQINEGKIFKRSLE